MSWLLVFVLREGDRIHFQLTWLLGLSSRWQTDRYGVLVLNVGQQIIVQFLLFDVPPITRQHEMDYSEADASSTNHPGCMGQGVPIVWTTPEEDADLVSELAWGLNYALEMAWDWSLLPKVSGIDENANRAWSMYQFNWSNVVSQEYSEFILYTVKTENSNKYLFLNYSNVAPNNLIVMREGCSIIPIEWQNNEKRHSSPLLESKYIGTWSWYRHYRHKWLDLALPYPDLLLVNEHIMEVVHLRWVDEAFRLISYNLRRWAYRGWM